MFQQIRNIPYNLKWLITSFVLPAASFFGGALFKTHPVEGVILWLGLAIILAVATYPGRYDQKALEECLQAFCKTMQFVQDADIRCTIWVPDKKGEWLNQVTNYMPANVKGRGDRLNKSKGIVGLAYRNKEYKICVLPSAITANPQAFRAYMKDNYGFSDEEAHRVKADRGAYIAVPIMGKDNTVLGVIYCDSHNRSAFGTEEDPSELRRTQELIEALTAFFSNLLK